MRSTRRRRKLSMTSLIDVIFLLLLFFMLTSTFTRFAELDLAAASGGGGASHAHRQVCRRRVAVCWRHVGDSAATALAFSVTAPSSPSLTSSSSPPSFCGDCCSASKGYAWPGCTRCVSLYTPGDM